MRIKSLLLAALVFFAIESAVILSSAWMLGDFPGLRINTWVILEWLINYQGGFIRRGLAGEALVYLTDNRNLLHAVYVMTLAMYWLYVALFLLIYRFASVRNFKVLLLALIIPGGLWHMALGPSFFTRKEILFLLLFALLCLNYLYILRVSNRRKAYYLGLFVLISILGGALLELVHEGYLFMGLPITTLLYWILIKENPNNRRLLQIGWAVYAGLVTGLFILSVFHHGSANTAQIIWDNLPLADRLVLAPSAPYTVYGTIGGIGWGLRQHLSTIYGVFATGGIWFWLFFAIGNSLLLSYVALQIATHQSSGFTSRYLKLVVIGFITSLGMLFIGSDWGRWLAAAGNQTLLLALTLNQSPYAREAIPISSQSGALCKPLQKRLLSFILSSTGFILLAFYGLVFDMPECCVYFEKSFVNYAAYLQAILQTISQ